MSMILLCYTEGEISNSTIAFTSDQLIEKARVLDLTDCHVRRSWESSEDWRRSWHAATIL